MEKDCHRHDGQVGEDQGYGYIAPYGKLKQTVEYHE
jgi:hypothetical protein